MTGSEREKTGEGAPGSARFRAAEPFEPADETDETDEADSNAPVVRHVERSALTAEERALADRYDRDRPPHWG